MKELYMDIYKVNEKDFLLGYHDFTLNIRIDLLNILGEKYNNINSTKIEKESILIMMEEQFFLIMETFFGFSYAFFNVGENNKKSFISLLNTKFETIDNFYKQLTSNPNIIKSRLENIKSENIDIIASELTKIWTNKNFYKAIKYILIPNLNISKHKLLMYKKKDIIIKILDDNKQNQILELSNDIGDEYKEDLINPNKSEYFFNTSQNINKWISDIINLRLIELGVSILN